MRSAFHLNRRSGGTERQEFNEEVALVGLGAETG
jgi:hypothetical protein